MHVYNTCAKAYLRIHVDTHVCMYMLHDISRSKDHANACDVVPNLSNTHNLQIGFSELRSGTEKSCIAGNYVIIPASE